MPQLLFGLFKVFLTTPEAGLGRFDGLPVPDYVLLAPGNLAGELFHLFIKALDFVRTPNGALALVTETHALWGGARQASIRFVGPSLGERNAWWNEDELEVVDSLPRILAYSIAHPFGSGRVDAERFFGPRPE